MPKLRVLIVDDSAVARRVLAENLASDPGIEVAGFATNGRLALARIPQVNPDVVTLDIEMPEMDGIEALKEIRQAHPLLPVIMVSAIHPREAATTVDALVLGASDYVVKSKTMRKELILKIKMLCARRAAPRTRVDVLAIGTSTGGPNALTEILPPLPANLPFPILIVQHMPPMFTNLLAERLSKKCRFPVHEAVSGDILRPGQAWLAPGDYHMGLQRQGEEVRITLQQGPPENACRPSVDVLLRSVAEIYGAGALMVMMTGMGSDGLLGCRQLRESQGRIIAQDEATSVVWGMSGAVVRAGLAEKVLPLQAIAGEIIERAQRGRTAALS